MSQPPGPAPNSFAPVERAFGNLIGHGGEIIATVAVVTLVWVMTLSMWRDPLMAAALPEPAATSVVELLTAQISERGLTRCRPVPMEDCATLCSVPETSDRSDSSTVCMTCSGDTHECLSVTVVSAPTDGSRR